jgi:hypothetical protein
VIFGGVFYNAVTAVPFLADTPDRKVAYTFHCYEPFIFTHQGAYWVDKMPLDFRISYPATVTEYKAQYDKIGLNELCDFSHITVKKLSEKYFEERFSEAKRVAEERNVPVYCGEYGVINLADPQDTLNWYKDIHAAFEKYGFGRAAWSYKEMDYGLSDEHISGVINELIKYL